MADVAAGAHVGGLAEFAASRHAAFTRRQAASLSVGSSTLRRMKAQGILDEPVPGVLRCSAAPQTWEQHLIIAAMATRVPGLAIATAASRLHQLDGFDDVARLHVAMERGTRHPRPDVHVSWTLATYAPGDIATVAGIQCAGLARTLCDLAQYEPDRYLRAADDFQRRGASLAWLEQTALRLQRHGRPGPSRVLADVQLRRTGGRVTDSWFERLMEDCLVSRRLPGLVRQVSVYDEDGRFVARVDGAIPQLRLAFEANSRQFHTGPRPEAFDQRRDNLLAAQGWETRYLGWSDTTRSRAATVGLVERIVARRTDDLGVDLQELLRAA